ncbi:MAG: hypothetical protein J5604_01570 [Bacteroidales bacterium]|nr:hypothetical protein [Bacteroidales bacterium]
MNEKENNKTFFNDPLEENKLLQIPFTVPENYFEELEEKLNATLSGQKQDGKWGALLRTIKASLALAASFLIIFGLGWGVMHLTKNVQNRSELTANAAEDALIDSLMQEYGAIEIARFYEADEEIDDRDLYLDDDYLDAIGEYVESTSASYNGILAEEFKQ